MTTWRLYVGHERERYDLRPTNRTFKAKNYDSAMNKASRFCHDAQLSYMAFDVKQEDDDARSTT